MAEINHLTFSGLKKKYLYVISSPFLSACEIFFMPSHLISRLIPTVLTFFLFFLCSRSFFHCGTSSLELVGIDGLDLAGVSCRIQLGE